MTLNIYRNGVVVESVTIDDTAKLTQSFMGGNYLNVPLTVTRKLDVLPLDYVFFEGERYTLYDEPESRVFDGMIDYTLVFHAPYFELYNKRYKNLGDLEFDYSGDLVDFLNVLIESMGEESGFTLGAVESIGWQTITFSNKSCYGALVDICKAFEAEFVVVGKEISAGKSLAADTAYTFEYGRGKGLYELKREEIGNSSVVTVLHVFGGTTNVPAGYHVGGKYGRLALPAPLTQNVDIYGIREDEVTFDEIYPRLKDKGLLAVIVPEDIASAAYWRVKLDIDFDLSKCAQPGLTAQLQFRSGELMGITFDLLAGSFDNTTKEVSIIVKEEGDARYPSLTRQPKVGDQFVLLNIDMDESYLTAAQEELQQKGQEYLDKVSSTQWLYKLTIDPHEYGRRGYIISVGDKIRVKDSRLGFDAKIRVSERTVQLTDPRNIELTISDEVLYSSDERLNHEVSGNSEQVSIHSDDIRAQYLMLKYNEQVLKQIVAAVEPILDVIYYDPDLDAVVTRKDFLSQKGISAYGLGSTSGSGTSGSLGELVNVGQWADEVPAADRVMVQLAGATHWSAKPLSDLVGLDTTALAQYLTENSYLKAGDISSYLTWANLSGKPTVYPTSWELVTGRPTKLSDLTDDVVAGNYLPKPTWDAVFEVVTVDGTPALKVKYDILGLKGITAYADGSLSGGFSGALVDLVDVAVTNLASGEILKYNGTHFVNVPVSSIAGASSWDQITGKPEYYPTRWADVSGAPTSLPASDVYPWAKAASKPTYTAAEVGALALSGGTLTGNVITIGSFILANSGAYPQLTFRATTDNSERLLFRHGNDLKWRYNGTNDGIIYHSGNFNPSSKLDKSVWDEAFELKTVNGVRVISAKLDFLSVAGISAYATGPSSGGGGGGLDYDLLKQALTGAITPDGYPFTISASFLGAIDKTYLTGKLANTYADKVHTHLWADITDRPTALPANGGNADTVDNLHASSFTRADQSPTVDLNTVNGQGIMACGLNEFATTERHYPIQQAGTLFYGTAAYGSACQIYGSFNSNRWFVRGGGTSQTAKTPWAEIWTTVNFNPDNYLLKTANAVSASKWATARTLTLTGSAAGSVSIDGSANVSLSVTNNRLNSNSEMTYGWNGINYFNLAGTAGAAAKINDTPTTAWWHILRFNHGSSAGYYTDLAVPFNDNTLYYKRVTSGTLQNGGWVKIWDAKNSNLSTIDWSANNLNAAANLDVAGQAYVSGWLRSRGNVGWYSQDYGGGIHMTDSTWVRVYGSKGLMIDTGTSPFNMGQLQITCSAEASIGFRSASNGNWCLGKGVSSIGSGFGLYNAATNRVAFQIASATDNASFVGSITAPTFVGNLSGSASSVNGYDINSFTGYYKYTIDASSLDQNTYYPVTMYLGNHHTVRISVLVALDSGTKPAWSSHASGYSVRFIEEVNGSGWGVSEVSRNILANEYRFANANPVGRVEQMTNSSTEVIWVRGGGKYFFYLSIPYITPALRTSTFTNSSQSVSPRTDTMDLRMAANGNGIAVSKLYAHNSIEINGFTIDVYNGALRVNGNLVATGGVASLATA